MESPSEQAKFVAGQAYERLMKTFAAVPDDKLTWSPAPTSKSALQIAAHCGFSNQFLAGVIQGETSHIPGSMKEMEEGIKQKLATITSRAKALDLLSDSIAKVNAALDNVTTEALQTQVTLPFGQMPMAFLIFAPGTHMQTHAAQIDYIQTIWGDTAMH
jgi:hypothetical protein